MALERPRFTTTKLREGYDIGDVDDAIDRIFVALADPGTSMTAAEISSLRFDPVRLRDGYDMGEVDEWLDQAAAELGRTSGAAAAVDPVAPIPTPPGEPAAALAAAQAAYDGSRSEAIVEVPSRGPWFAMLALALLVVAIAVVYVVG